MPLAPGDVQTPALNSDADHVAPAKVRHATSSLGGTCPSLRCWRSVALFLVVLVGADRAAGAALQYASAHALDGERSGGLLRAALADRSAEWVVFGSSRVRRHVDPAPLASALGARVRNAGCDGQGVLYARLLAALMREEGSRGQHYVLDINPHDFVDDRAARLGVFAPYWGQSSFVDAALEERDPAAPLKMLSRVYRYNSAGLPALARALRGVEASDGFAPLAPRRGTPAQHAAETLSRRSWARGRAHYAGFVEDARQAGVDVHFLIGPRRGGWPPQEARILDSLVGFARDTGVRVVDLRAMALPDEYWVDDVHFDARGAAAYSQALADALAGDLGGLGAVARFR